MIYSIIIILIMTMIGFGAYIYKSFQKDKMMDDTNKLYQQQNTNQSADYKDSFSTNVNQPNTNYEQQRVNTNQTNLGYEQNNSNQMNTNYSQTQLNNNGENNFRNQTSGIKQNVAFVNGNNNISNNINSNNGKLNNQQYSKDFNQIDDGEKEKIEGSRKSVRNSQLIGLGIAVLFLITVAIIYFFLYKAGLNGDKASKNSLEIFRNIVPFLAFIVIGIIMVITGKKKKKYTNTYKTEVIGKLIKSINPNLTYQPEVYGTMVSSINQLYKQAKFDNLAYNCFDVDDYIEGFLSQNVYIKMCDLDVENETEDVEDHTRHRSVVFRGLFAMTNCNIDIGTNIKIKKHEIRVFDSKDRFKLDDEVFEKHFDVYTQNGVKTMQILTPDIMEQLVNFVDASGIKFEVVFDGNKILFRFFTGKMFEPSVFKDSMDSEILTFYSNILRFTLDVTNKINKILTQGNIV